MSRTTLAAAVVVAVVALGGALFVIERDRRAVAGPSPTASADPSPSLPGVVPPSATPKRAISSADLVVTRVSTGAWIATGAMGTPRDGTLGRAAPRWQGPRGGWRSRRSERR